MDVAIMSIHVRIRFLYLLRMKFKILQLNFKSLLNIFRKTKNVSKYQPHTKDHSKQSKNKRLTFS